MTGSIIIGKASHFHRDLNIESACVEAAENLSADENAAEAHF